MDCCLDGGHILPDDATQEMTVAFGDGERRAGSQDPRHTRLAAVAVVQRAILNITEVTNGRDSLRHLPFESPLDPSIEFGIRQLAGPFRASQRGIEDQMHMAVDQAGHQCASVLSDLASVWHIERRGLDSNDGVALDQDSRAAVDEALAVECRERS